MSYRANSNSNRVRLYVSLIAIEGAAQHKKQRRKCEQQSTDIDILYRFSLFHFVCTMPTFSIPSNGRSKKRAEKRNSLNDVNQFYCSDVIIPIAGEM